METKRLSSPQGPNEDLVFYAKPVETVLAIIHVCIYTIRWTEIASPAGVTARSHVSQAFADRVARCIELLRLCFEQPVVGAKLVVRAGTRNPPDTGDLVDKLKLLPENFKPW